MANTHSAAATFTNSDVTPGVKHVCRVQAISAEGRSQRSNYVNVTRRTGDGSRQRVRPRDGTGGPGVKCASPSVESASRVVMPNSLCGLGRRPALYRLAP